MREYKPFKMKGSPMKRNFPNDVKANPGDSPVEAWDWGSAGGGAASGAAKGAAFGPWGAAIGGVLGGVMSGISGGKAKEAEAAAMKEEEKNRIVAEKLKKDEERKSLGYSEFNATENA